MPCPRVETPAPDQPDDPGKRRLMVAGMAATLGLGLAGGAPQRLAASHTGALRLPTGPTVLEVGGGITRHNKDGIACFDDDMLGELPQTRFVTSTIWTSGQRAFSGPSLRMVLDAVQAEGSLVAAEAANAYRSTFRISDIEDEVPIIARRIDDQPFRLRDRGPLWIVFPYDLDARFRTETVYAQSVWQLVALTVTDG